MAKHFADILQGDAIIQHHVSKEMSGVVGVQPSDTSCDVTNITQVCQLLQIGIIPEIAIHRDQLIVGHAIGMGLIFLNQFLDNWQYRYHFADLRFSSFANQPPFSLRTDKRNAITSQPIDVLVGKAGEALKDESVSHLSQPFNMQLLSMNSFHLLKLQRNHFTSPPEHLKPSIGFRVMKSFLTPIFTICRVHFTSLRADISASGLGL